MKEHVLMNECIFFYLRINPKGPESDQRQIYPCNITAYKTEWSWELRTWSHKMNLIDTSTNSPYYFHWKRITDENLNVDVKV